MPLIRQRPDDIALKSVVVRKRKQALSKRLDLFVNLRLQSAQRLQLTAAVVQNPDRAVEAKLASARRDLVSVVGLLNIAAENGIDGHIKMGIFGEPLQFTVEDFQALFGNFVRLNIIDTDLQVIQSGFVQILNAVRREQITVRNQSGNRPVAANAPDQDI